MAQKARGIFFIIVLLPFWPIYYGLKRLFKDPEEVEFDRMEKHNRALAESKKINKEPEKYYTRIQNFLQKLGGLLLFDFISLYLALNPATYQDTFLYFNAGYLCLIIFLILSSIGALRYFIIIIYKLTDNYRSPVTMVKSPKYTYHFWGIEQNGFRIPVFTDVKTGEEILGITSDFKKGENGLLESIFINPRNGEVLTKEEVEKFNKEYIKNSNPDEYTQRVLKETNRSGRVHGMKELSEYSRPIQCSPK